MAETLIITYNRLHTIAITADILKVCLHNLYTKYYCIGKIKIEPEPILKGIFKEVSATRPNVAYFYSGTYLEYKFSTYQNHSYEAPQLTLTIYENPPSRFH